MGDLADGYSNRILQNYEDKIRMKRLYNFIENFNGLDILDVGSGTGRWAIQLSRKGGILTGVDISKEMIKVANKRVCDSKIINVKFFNKRIDDLTFFNDGNVIKNNYDIVISITVLQHIISDDLLNDAIQNIIDATKKNGTIFIIESEIFNKKAGNNVESTRYTKFRTGEEWISLFEQKGVKKVASGKVCSIGRLLVYYSSHIHSKRIVEYSWKIGEILDTKLSEFRILRRIAKPSYFVFKKY